MSNMSTMQVRVKSKWQCAEEVAAFELVDAVNENAPLPPAQAGAHIDVHLPNGLVRQYSLTDCCSDACSYVIGVKREPNSRGGSAAMHELVKPGDVLQVSLPRNNFPLQKTGGPILLIAGGIGITPLLAMARSLAADPASRDKYALHYFCRSPLHAAFSNEIAALQQADGMVYGADVNETATRIRQLLQQRPDGAHLYTCGPGPMIATVVATARECGWPEEAIHVEYFSNQVDHGGERPFRVRCANSNLEFQVAVGQSIVEAAAEAGLAIATSCEQGVCGTCLTNVLSGQPDHRDLYLTEVEKASGKQILPCVSRCRGDELVLDL